MSWYKSKFSVMASLLPSIAMLAGCGGGGDGNGAGAGAPVAAPVVQAGTRITYPQTVVLGNLTPQSVGLVDAQGTSSALIVTAISSTLLASGQTPVVAVHRSSKAAGALAACVSAPTSSTGTIDGINLGVNIKSVATLMDATWTQASDQPAAWASIAAGGAAGIGPAIGPAIGPGQAVFEGWENCGAKPEGLPSPGSLRAVNADGSFSEDVYDGNPSTNLNIITLHGSATQAAQMLSSEGYLNTTQRNAAKRVWLRVYRNTANQTILVEQGLPETGSSTASPGYMAAYFMR